MSDTLAVDLPHARPDTALLLDAAGTLLHLAWLDLLVVSGEERLEKPDPAIFARACARLGVAPEQAIHLGNDADDDILGARAAGCVPLLIGHDVADFADLARRLLAPTH